MDLLKLHEPFPPDDIEWRVAQAGKSQAGKLWARVLAYVTNRAIMQRLDDVCGPDNWRNEYREGPGGGVLCGLSIRVLRGFGDPQTEETTYEWVTKWDGAENTDVEAVKGGLSGAMKRAAVQWGVGRYLYGLEEGWANIHEGGRFQGSTKERDRFKWDPPALPPWALPSAADRTVTTAQVELIERMMGSHVVTDAERDGIKRRLGSGTDTTQATECIDWLKRTLAARKAEEKQGVAA